MTTDGLQGQRNPPPIATGTGIGSRMLAAILTLLKPLGYIVAFAAYLAILIVAIATMGLIEIRQANLQNSNALIAMLDQKDYYGRNPFARNLLALAAEIDSYKNLRRDVSDCSSQTPSDVKDHNQTAAVTTVIRAIASAGNDVKPTTCEELKTIVDQHLLDLHWLQDRFQMKQAFLPKYYNEYIDGLRNKTPQLVPLLRYMESKVFAVTAWARLPLELLEMLLLIFMGALGAVIAVTRYFVDTSVPNPEARDLYYRPVAGAVIALGIYVLFRAAQLFFGGGGQDATTVSTSVFVLAALGLASGFCAKEAVAQIERVATRLLQGAKEPPAPDWTTRGL
jgi:hypothetical protein